MKAVITVLGKDNVGIMAKVANACAERTSTSWKLHRVFFRTYLQ